MLHMVCFFNLVAMGISLFTPGWPLIISSALGNFWEMESQLGWNGPVRGEFFFWDLRNKSQRSSPQF